MEFPSESTAFPVEIIERIIDDLQDDIDALSSISQTCRALLQSCRKRLFRCTDLSPQGLLPAEEFRYILMCNPEIGHYVRELVLYINWALPEWDPSTSVNADTENIQTLTQMPFLKKLHILGGQVGISFAYTSWTALHPTLREPVLDRIHSLSLTEITISYFEIPVTVFRSCVNLSIVTLVGVESEMPEPIDEVEVSSQPVAIPQLRSFTFETFSVKYASALVHSRCSDGYPAIRFDVLKTLIAPYGNKNNAQVIEDIFRQAAKLEKFVCMANGLYEEFGGLAGWINVSAFSTLKILEVVFSVGENGDPLRGLCEELEMFPHSNVLEKLDLEIHVGRKHLIFPPDKWGRLDVVLSRGFPLLRRVSISVILLSYLEWPEIERIRTELEEISWKEFPWLRENAALKFDFSTTVRQFPPTEVASHTQNSDT